MSDPNIALSGEAIININKECLKSTSNLTGTTYYNICNGKELTVPTGSWDWVLGFLGILLFAGVVTVVGALATKLVTLLINREDWGL